MRRAWFYSTEGKVSFPMLLCIRIIYSRLNRSEIALKHVIFIIVLPEALCVFQRNDLISTITGQNPVVADVHNTCALTRVLSMRDNLTFQKLVSRLI